MFTRSKVVGGILLVVVVVAVAGCLLEDTSNYSPTTHSYTPGGGASGVVTYSVTGSASAASLTYQNDSGGTNQQTVNLPWTRTFSGFGSGDFLYVSAQNQDDHGTLRCEIKIGSRVAFSSDASGAYSICTASGSYGG